MQKLENTVEKPLGRAEVVRAENDTRLRALVIDKVGDGLLDTLRAEGFEVDCKPGLGADDVRKEICKYHMLVGRTRVGVDREMMDSAVNLKIICRAAVGIENIDTAEAAKRGISVINAPGAATESVAELTLSLTFNALRNVIELNSKLRNGVFEKKAGSELSGKNVGIIGFGRIGHRFAEMLGPFGVRIMANDLPVCKSKVERAGFEFSEKETLLAESDIISLHVNMDVNSKPVLGEAEFAKMKKGVIIINTGRAAAVDMKALHDGVFKGNVGFYAADVLWNEPPKDKLELELIRSEKTLFTPHIGAQTKDAQDKVAETLGPCLVKAIRDCRKG
jgi:D-3-phosphoglycerate dehydrogenase